MQCVEIPTEEHRRDTRPKAESDSEKTNTSKKRFFLPLLPITTLLAANAIGPAISLLRNLRKKKWGNAENREKL